MLVCTNALDPTDSDYLSIAQITMYEAELKEYVGKSLKIYTDAKNNDRISYLALTDSHKMYEASRSIRQQRSQSRYA